MANFIAMALVRDVHLSRVRGAPPARGRALEGVRVYASDQTHFSIGRALDELGFPPETLAVVPAGDDFRLRASPVEAAIRRDRAAGLTPIAIAAVAGSTNTGAVDAVGELADLADRQGLWLHVDAAYGAAARLSARDAGRVPDLARAQSVTVDPHKWLFQAYDIGGLMVRERGVLGEAFGGRRPEYYRAGHERNGTDGSDGAGHDSEAAGRDTLADDDGHGSADQLNFWRLGFEGTRRWRALKLWLSWKHVGIGGLRAAGRGEQRPGRAPRRANRRVRRLRGAARRSAAVRRVLPTPAGRTRRSRRPPGPAPGRARGERRGLAHDNQAARGDVPPGRDPQHAIDHR